MRKIWQCSMVILLMCVRAGAQDGFSERARKYVDEYASLAMAEQRKNHVPAAITLGQGILETEAGASELMLEANNHFGIKCKNGWTGETYTHTDDAPDECFKKYTCAAESYSDHSLHLKRNQRYSVLFTLKQEDYRNWAVCLKKCGYATNPQYAQRLIKIIEDYGLQQYTLSAFDSSILNNYENNPVANAQTQPDMKLAMHVSNPQPMPESGYVQPATQHNSNANTVKKEHIVMEGETLTSIAKEEHIDLRKLMSFNLLNPNEEPVAGTILQLQSAAMHKPEVKIRPIAAHRGNAIDANTSQQGDFITLNKGARTVADTQKAKVANTTAAPQQEKPKPIIIIEEPARKRRPVEQPDLSDPAVKKEMEFTALKAELDKVVYADDSQIIAENKTVTPPPATEKKPVAPRATTPHTAQFYTVKKGDTAFSIAKKNGITLEQLTAWNNLGNGGVKVGQTLQVKE